MATRDRRYEPKKRKARESKSKQFKERAAVKQAKGSQITKAENLRNMLLEHHNLTGKDAEKFERIIRGMTATELTNLARQYHGALEVFNDSNGASAVISQDFMKRVLSMKRSKLKYAVRAVLNKKDGGTNTNRKIGYYSSPYNKNVVDFSSRDVTLENKLKTLGFNAENIPTSGTSIVGKYGPLDNGVIILPRR